MTLSIIPLETSLSRGASALAEPIRLEVLRLLKAGAMRPIDIEEKLGLAQSRLGFHLKVLREAGLVQVRREQQFSYYRRDEQAINALKSEVLEV